MTNDSEETRPAPPGSSHRRPNPRRACPSPRCRRPRRLALTSDQLPPGPGPSGRSLADESRDLRYEALKDEVDALQVLVMKQQQPWYRDAAAIVAVLALVFSFGTTIVSYQRTSQEDIHASEIELRALLSRSSAIPAEMTENARTYADDPGAVARSTSVLTQEQILLAKQAAQVLFGIPQERVTAAQYLLVANVLIGNGIDREGLQLVDSAIAVARDVNDFVSAVRVKAFRLFQLQRADEGRDLYQQALAVWDRRGFETQDTNFRAYTDLQTRVGWAAGGAERRELRRDAGPDRRGAQDRAALRSERHAGAADGGHRRRARKLSAGRGRPVAVAVDRRLMGTPGGRLRFAAWNKERLTRRFSRGAEYLSGPRPVCRDR